MVNLEALVPDSFRMQLAAQTALPQGPRPIPYHQEFDTHVLKMMHQDFPGMKIHAPTAEQKKELDGIFSEIEARVPAAVPSARYYNVNTKSYVVDQELANSMPYPVGQHVGDEVGGELGMAVTSGMLKSPVDASHNLSRAELKSVMAHEYAHHLMIMNKELANDPRYQPQSAQYKAEYAALKANHATPEQLEFFHQEAVADIIGLRLSGDAEAAKSAMVKMDHQNKLIMQKNAPQGTHENPDTPHPSQDVRRAEIDITHNAMMAAAAKQPKGHER